MYKNVEKIAAKGFNEVPDLVKKKKAQYEKIQQEIQNYLNFIKIGNLSKAVADALTDAEKRNEEIKQEVESLEFQKENSFKAPPKEWINHRLENLRETLNKNTVSSALALKELLAPIMLEPVTNESEDFYGIVKGCANPEIASGASHPRNDTDDMDSRFRGNDRKFKPYYVAHTKIRTLALLDEERKGSNWYQIRTHLQSNRKSQENEPNSSNWYKLRRGWESSPFVPFSRRGSSVLS